MSELNPEQAEPASEAGEASARRDAAVVAAVTTSRRWDAYAAIIASFVGLLALAVSAYTAYVQRQQLRAQVWPYVMLTYSNIEDGMAFSIANQGTGPARITALEVTVAGKPVQPWDGVGQAAGFVRAQNESTLSSGFLVLPAGKQIDFLRPDNNPQSRTKFKRLFADGEFPLAISVCYCSVLDECWSTTIGPSPPRIEPCPAEPPKPH